MACTDGKERGLESEECGEGLKCSAGEVGRRELGAEGGSERARRSGVLGHERQQVPELRGAQRGHSLSERAHSRGEGESEQQKISNTKKRKEA